MTTPVVDEYGSIVHPTDNIDEWGVKFINGWSEDGRFRTVISISKILNEILTLVDVKVTTPQRILGEVFTCADSIVKAPLKTFVESVFPDDLAIEYWTGRIHIFVEALTLTEGTIRASVERTLHDTLWTRVNKWLDEWGKVAFFGGITEYGRYWDESSILSTSTEVGDRVVQVGYTEIVGDFLEKSLARSLTETLSTYHSWPLRVISGRVLSDTMHLEDVGLFGQVKVFIEAIGLGDQLITRSISRQVLEGVSVVDEVVKSVAPSVLVELINILDRFISGKEQYLVEALNLTDPRILKSATREWIEAITGTDILLKSATLVDFVEALGLHDILIRGGEYYKLLMEALGVADRRIQSMVDVYKNEMLSVADDTVSRYVSIHDLIEALGLEDILEVITVAYKLLTEALGLSDRLNFNPLWCIYEGIVTEDVLLKNPQPQPFIEVFGGLVDTIQRTPGVVRSETVTLNDAVLERELGILVRELLVLADIPNFIIERELEDMLELFDGVARLFKNRVRRMSGTISKSKLGSFIKRKVHNTFKQRYKNSTFQAGEDEE